MTIPDEQDEGRRNDDEPKHPLVPVLLDKDLNAVWTVLPIETESGIDPPSGAVLVLDSKLVRDAI